MDKESNKSWGNPAANQAGPSTGRPDGKTEDGHPVISTERARSGITLHAMRYVLGVSIGLVVIVFAVAAALSVLAGLASLLRGGRTVTPPPTEQEPAEPATHRR